MKKNQGLTFILQQISSLLVKRFKIFYRRYILATLILLLPFLLEAVLSGIIPTSTNLVNTQTTQVRTVGEYQLGMSAYRTNQVLSYFVNTNGFSTGGLLQAYLTSAYPSSDRITLSQLPSDTVNDHILSLRKSSLDNLIYQYYAGI